LERVVDAVEVILRVGLLAGAPRHLIAEDDLAVDHRGALTIAGAEIEADPAAFEMAAERGGGFPLVGAGVIRGGDNLHRMAVDTVAHEIEVEGAGAGGRVDGAKVIGESGVARDRHAVAPLLPEEELE